MTERHATALRGTGRGTDTEQRHVVDDRVVAIQPIVAAELDRAHAAVAERQVGLAHVHHVVLGDGVAGRGCRPDTDQRGHIVFVLARLRADRQIAGQQAIADDRAVVLATASERAAAKREAADVVARARVRRIEGIDIAAHRQRPVAGLELRGACMARADQRGEDTCAADGLLGRFRCCVLLVHGCLLLCC